MIFARYKVDPSRQLWLFAKMEKCAIKVFQYVTWVSLEGH